MYIHLGGDEMVSTRDLVMIIDAGVMHKGPINTTFLRMAEDKGLLQKVGEGSVNAYVITTHMVIASPISASTLRKRAENCHFDMA